VRSAVDRCTRATEATRKENRRFYGSAAFFVDAEINDSSSILEIVMPDRCTVG